MGRRCKYRPICAISDASREPGSSAAARKSLPESRGVPASIHGPEILALKGLNRKARGWRREAQRRAASPGWRAPNLPRPERAESNDRERSDSALSGRGISGATHPGARSASLRSASPAPGFTIQPLRGQDRRTVRGRSSSLCLRRRALPRERPTGTRIARRFRQGLMRRSTSAGSRCGCRRSTWGVARTRIAASLGAPPPRSLRWS